MLTDPQSTTIGATAHSLPRVSGPTTQGRRLETVYRNADETVTMTVQQSTTGENRKRHWVQFTQRKVVTDPLSASNDFDSASIAFSFDRPSYGFTIADLLALFAAAKASLTDAKVTQLYGGEA